MVPNLRIGGRELTAVGKRGFHGSIAMPLNQSDAIATFNECVSCSDARDAATNNDIGFHGWSNQYVGGLSSLAPCAMNTPSVLDLRDSQVHDLLAPAVLWLT